MVYKQNNPDLLPSQAPIWETTYLTLLWPWVLFECWDLRYKTLLELGGRLTYVDQDLSLTILILKIYLSAKAISISPVVEIRYHNSWMINHCVSNTLLYNFTIQCNTFRDWIFVKNELRKRSIAWRGGVDSAKCRNIKYLQWQCERDKK